MIETTAGRSGRGRTQTPGAPSERATPPTVRVWSDALKTSIARCILSSALVGTARMWLREASRRGRRLLASRLLTPRRRRLGRGGRLGGLELVVLRLAHALAPSGAQALHERAPLVARVAQLEVVGPGLADPALVLGARRAEVADPPPLAAGEEMLGVLAAQEGASADIAGDVELVRADVPSTSHSERARVAMPLPLSAGIYATASASSRALSATFWARCAGISS